MPIKCVLHIWIDGVRYGVSIQQFWMIVLSVLFRYILHSSIHFLLVFFLFMCKCVLLFVSNSFDNKICVELNMNMDDSFYQAADVHISKCFFLCLLTFVPLYFTLHHFWIHYYLCMEDAFSRTHLNSVFNKIEMEYQIFQMLCGVRFKRFHLKSNELTQMSLICCNYDVHSKWHRTHKVSCQLCFVKSAELRKTPDIKWLTANLAMVKRFGLLLGVEWMKANK